MIKNLIKILKSKIWISWIVFWITVIMLPYFYFLNKQLLIGNLWYSFFLIELTLTIIIAILFWLFIWSTVYKIKYFSVGKSWIWIMWWFLWVLVTGCPACSITFASYLWLAGIMSVFPYNWLELKVLSIAILLYVNYTIIKTLEVCKIKS